MVQEYSVELSVEELGWYLAFKLVEAEIQELKRRQREDNVRELPNEPVVAKIKLVKKLHAIERERDLTAETV